MPTLSRAFTWSYAGVRVQVVDDADADLAARLECDPPTRPGSTDTDTPDLTYVVQPWQAAWDKRGRGYRVRRDDKLCYLGHSPEHLAQWLRVDIDAQVSQHTKSLLLQAAAVVWRGRAILIPRRCRTGTSTLVAALVGLGASNYSDRFIRLDHAGRIHPHPGPMAADPPLVAMVVSTTYHAELPWQPQMVRGVRAVLPILDSIVAEQDDAHQMLRLAAPLARTVVTLQGTRAEASLAAPQILAVVDECSASQPLIGTTPTRTARLQSRARDVLATINGAA